MTTINTTPIENAISRSIIHNEITRCEFEGDYQDLQVFIHENYANGNDAIFSEALDGSIDIDDIDGNWRIKVVLT